MPAAQTPGKEQAAAPQPLEAHTGQQHTRQERMEQLAHWVCDMFTAKGAAVGETAAA